MHESTYVVTEVPCTARLLAGVRAIVPVGRVGAVFRTYLDQVYAAARLNEIALDGQNVFVYRPHPSGQLLVEFCVGALRAFESVGTVVTLETPVGLAATTTHWGDYAGLSAAHAAIREWCSAHGRTMAGTSWEIYGHWHETPAKVRTDVYYLLQDARATL
jgi:hypothetical protein